MVAKPLSSMQNTPSNQYQKALEWLINPLLKAFTSLSMFHRKLLLVSETQVSFSNYRMFANCTVVVIASPTTTSMHSVSGSRIKRKLDRVHKFPAFLVFKSHLIDGLCL